MWASAVEEDDDGVWVRERERERERPVSCLENVLKYVNFYKHFIMIFD